MNRQRMKVRNSHIWKAVMEDNKNIIDVAAEFKVSRRTVYHALRKQQLEEDHDQA